MVGTSNKEDFVLLGKPKRKYRVTIRELITKKVPKESARSFMIYDYVGDSNINSIKKRLSIILDKKGVK